MTPQERKAVELLLDSIEAMWSAEKGGQWFGGFSEFDTEIRPGLGYPYELVHVEWPNLEIASSRVRELLKQGEENGESCEAGDCG